jgi:hypothetical protein
VQWLIDENGYIVGYRNPMTQENVYGWFSGSGSSGDPVTYVASDYVAAGYVI